MNDSFISVFSGFIFTQAVGRGTGHALQCTESWVWDYNKQRVTYWSAKWDDILKLCETDKQNVLYHLLPSVMHRHLNAS
jgi:hypothetical protein